MSSEKKNSCKKTYRTQSKLIFIGIALPYLSDKKLYKLFNEYSFIKVVNFDKDERYNKHKRGNMDMNAFQSKATSRWLVGSQTLPI